MAYNCKCVMLSRAAATWGCLLPNKYACSCNMSYFVEASGLISQQAAMLQTFLRKQERQLRRARSTGNTVRVDHGLVGPGGPYAESDN